MNRLQSAFLVAAQFVAIAALLFERRVRRRAERTLREREASLRSSHQQLQALAGRLIAAQDAERARIARELRDDFGQQLAGFSIAINRIKRRLRDPGGDLEVPLDTLQRRASEMGSSLRQMSHDLYPGLLQHAGLVEAVQAHCREFSARHGIPVFVRAEAHFGRLDPAADLCLYRVIQEALHNVTKHAGAHHVSVSLLRTGDDVTLSITDDGHGFDAEQASEGHGLGLRTIEDRVRMEGGRLRIDSAAGLGTTLWVRLKVTPARHIDIRTPERARGIA